MFITSIKYEAKNRAQISSAPRAIDIAPKQCLCAGAANDKINKKLSSS